MIHSIEHPWQLAQSIWGQTIVFGTAIYMAVAAVMAGLQTAAGVTMVGLVAAMVSFPIVFPLRFLLPVVLRSPSLTGRRWGLAGLVLSHFMLAILPVALLVTEPAYYSWENLGLVTAYTSPFLLTAALVTWRTCRPWLGTPATQASPKAGVSTDDHAPTA